MNKYVLASLAVFFALISSDFAVGQEGIDSEGEGTSVDEIVYPDDMDSTITSYTEKMPVFPGGPEALYRFIGENLVYPELAIDKGIEGKVFVEFIIEKDGSTSNVKVIQGIDKACDSEAMRVIAIMPNWEPGTQRGKPVRVIYRMPFDFRLEQTEKKKRKGKKGRG